jgi:uncharacterized membrane protein YphA (DoxX/SURF4 family)
VKIVTTLISAIIGLLSIAAGAAKIALVPEEVEFLGQFGFTNSLTIFFGIMQVLGGILLLIPFTRSYGSLVAAAGFALSAVLLFASGDVVFASVSLLPFLLAGFVAYRSFSDQPSLGQSGDGA